MFFSQSTASFLLTDQFACLDCGFVTLLKVYVIFAYTNNYYAQIQQQKAINLCKLWWHIQLYDAVD